MELERRSSRRNVRLCVIAPVGRTWRSGEVPARRFPRDFLAGVNPEAAPRVDWEVPGIAGRGLPAAVARSGRH
jgi:hypothetical protein